MTTDERIAIAEQNFNSGLNCAQSVALAFGDLTGLDETALEAASAPFGGGVGRMREVCGTVSGMMMTLGLVRKANCRVNAEKIALYKEEQELAAGFKAKHGSIICRELLASAAADHSDPTLANSHKHSCVELVKNATEILAKYLEENPTK